MQTKDLTTRELAQNAFDVMIRRGWYAVPIKRMKFTWWVVRDQNGHDMPLAFITSHQSRGEFQDPFTALVEADKWYRENREKS